MNNYDNAHRCSDFRQQQFVRKSFYCIMRPFPLKTIIFSGFFPQCFKFVGRLPSVHHYHGRLVLICNSEFLILTKRQRPSRRTTPYDVI